MRRCRILTVCIFQISVLDANDNAPVIVSPISKNLYIGTGLPKGAHVDRIITADADSGDNGRVTYVISSGNGAGYFAINYETGEITMARPINTVENFILNVTASDHGSPMPLHAYTSLNISTRAKEENQLKFTKNVYHVNVTEDTSVGAVIFSISSNIIKYASGRKDEGGN